MVFVWKGMGFLTPLIIVGCVLLAHIALPTLNARDAVGFAVAAVANWFIGKRFNTGVGRTLRDEQSGEVFKVAQTHTFFWINMEWWSVPCVVFALLALN